MKSLAHGMDLQPPSFFEVTPGPSGAREDEQMEKTVRSQWRQELAKLSKENEILRYRY